MPAQPRAALHSFGAELKGKSEAVTERSPALGQGTFSQPVPGGGVEQTPHQPPLAISELTPHAAGAPLHVFIDSLVTSISPTLFLLIKCPHRHARQSDVILHSPALLPSWATQQ